jgi:hypothetical protein
MSRCDTKFKTSKTDDILYYTADLIRKQILFCASRFVIPDPRTMPHDFLISIDILKFVTITPYLNILAEIRLPKRRGIKLEVVRNQALITLKYQFSQDAENAKR